MHNPGVLQPKNTPKTTKAAPGHGGVRKGAGRKPTDHVPSDERLDYDSARARNETAKADLNELDLAVKRGEYVARSAVQQATATALSALTQTLRSIPDDLERTLGMDPHLAQDVGARIDAALQVLATQFEDVTRDAARQEHQDD